MEFLIKKKWLQKMFLLRIVRQCRCNQNWSNRYCETRTSGDWPPVLNNMAHINLWYIRSKENFKRKMLISKIKKSVIGRWLQCQVLESALIVNLTNQRSNIFCMLNILYDMRHIMCPLKKFNYGILQTWRVFFSRNTTAKLNRNLQDLILSVK